MADKDNIDIDIAAILRDIAANCDKTTGKILRLCDKAAKNGQSFITTTVSILDNEYLVARKYKDGFRKEDFKRLRVTPLVSKLDSLGFILNPTGITSLWGRLPIITVSW